MRGPVNRHLAKALAIVVALAVTLAVAGPAAAQSPSVTAEVDLTQATTDDVITLSVLVEGGNQVSQPSLPFMDGLVVVGRSSVSQVSITNGKMASTFLFEYRLVPTRTGKLTIGPVTISVDGVEESTSPLEIEVTRGSGGLAAPTATPQFDFDPATAPTTLAGQEHYVEAGVDEPNPYLGQQVIYSRRYYRAQDSVLNNVFERRFYEPPAFDGFWHRDLSDEGRYEVRAVGREYTVYEDQTVLFPSLVGRLTIDRGVMRVTTSRLRPPVVLVTRPVLVTVRPLPAGAPAIFDGAVGEYRIAASVDSTRLSGGDPVTMTVTVSGAGNIESLPEPRWPDSSDWRQFSQGSEFSSQVFQGRLRGSKTFTFLLLPNRDGALEVPSIEYVYFDPERETYVTMSTSPVRVEVEPGSIDVVAVQRALDADPAVAQDDPTTGAVLELKPLSGPVAAFGSVGGRGFTAPAWYWSLFALPVLAVASFEAFRSRRRIVGALNTVRSRAGRSPLVDLDNAPLSPDRRLLNYLSGRLARPAGGLAAERLALELGALGATDGLIARVRDVLDAGHARRFAPPGLRPDGGGEGTDVDDLIRRLDEELN